MGVLTAPVDELNEFIDQIQEWLNVNRLVDEAMRRFMEPILGMMDWVGDAASAFADMFIAKIMDELKPILSAIDTFLGALNAVIDAIQQILEVLMAPLNAIEEGISAIGDALGY